MNTYSERTRAIDRQRTNHLLLVVLVLAVALSTGCSISLVDQAPEVLRYCRVAERSEPPEATETTEQAPGPDDNAAADSCAGGADRVCDDDEIADAVARGDAVNCTP
jgi:hypothetical protein